MDEDQFIQAIAPRGDFIKIGKKQYGLLFRVADRNRRGLVSLEDYVQFQRLLKLPDAEFRVAFALFDVNQDGKLSLEEFTRVSVSSQSCMQRLKLKRRLTGFLRKPGAQIAALQFQRALAQTLHGR